MMLRVVQTPEIWDATDFRDSRETPKSEKRSSLTKVINPRAHRVKSALPPLARICVK